MAAIYIIKCMILQCAALGSINGGAAADVVMFREDAGNVTVTFQLVGDVADRAFVADVQNINTTSE